MLFYTPLKLRACFLFSAKLLPQFQPTRKSGQLKNSVDPIFGSTEATQPYFYFIPERNVSK